MMTFWTGTVTVQLPDPQDYDITFPADAEPTLTQGGFFVPIGAPDDMEAVAQVSWEALTAQELARLSAIKAPAIVSFTDPLDLHPRGYVKTLDHQTVDGRVAPDGGPMYSVQLGIQVLSVRWPDVMGMFAPDHDYQPGDRFGISASGRLPAEFLGSKGTFTDSDGWAEVSGGDTEPWGPVIPPVAPGPWERLPRTRISPIHGIQPNFLAMDSTQLSPTRGAVFLAFRPLA